MKPAPSAVHDVANLRLPVPFFDLLMVLLVTCLVFVAPVRPETEMQTMDVAIGHSKAAGSADGLIAVQPRRSAQGWEFVESDTGKILTPQELADRARTKVSKVALVVPPATAIQDFVDMQAALAALDVPFALAIKTKEASP